MRMRYLKGTEEILENSARMVWDAAAHRGSWARDFGKDKLYLELGCGRGSFIRGLAAENPGAVCIGLERISTILARAILDEQRGDETVPQDVGFRYVRAEASSLRDFFAPAEVDALYLNFSDPWPKDSHAKRRLTSDRFLPVYAELLKPGASLYFKTDNDALFAWSLESFKENGWELVEVTTDLHGDAAFAGKGGPWTEYETMFHEKGKNINYLEAKYKKKTAE